MRIFAFLMISLSLAAAFRMNASHSTELPSAANGQAINIFFQSPDGGKTWQDCSRGLPEKLEVRNVFSDNGEIFLGAENGTVYHSSDPQNGRWEVETVGGAFPEFGAYSEHENPVMGIFQGPSGIYASIYKAGFFKRDPKTKNWEPMHLNLGENVIHAVVETPDRTLFVSCEKGIFKSTNQGKTWSHSYSEGWITSMVAGNGILVATGKLGLIRSEDGGERWTYAAPQKDGEAYKISFVKGLLPTVPDHFAAVCEWAPANIPVESRQVMRISADGKNWESIDQIVPTISSMNSLTQSGNYLYCSHKNGISRSGDWGKTWQTVEAPAKLNDPFQYRLAAFGKTVYAVIVWGGC